MTRDRYTFLDLIVEVLTIEKREMTSSEIWQCAKNMGLDQKLSSTGKTPQNTVNSCIRKNLNNSKKTRFGQIGGKPVKYFLKK